MARALHILTRVKDPSVAPTVRAGFLARIFAGTSYPYAASDEVRFLSRRVRLFLSLLFWFFAVFTAGAAVKAVTLATGPAMVRGAWAATAVMAAITLFFGLGWLRHREPCACSRSSIELFEAAGTVLASVALGGIVLALPNGLPVWNLLLTMVLALVLRAAIVPSTAARTHAVGLLSTVALTVPVWIYLADAPDRMDRLVWTAVGTWGLVFTFATATVSRVIYGLRASVRRAMQLGSYTLERRIGEGGMGVVYLARHALLRRPTAVKMLRADRVGEHSVRRFEREVQQTSQLEHPNIVVIYDYGRTPRGQFYYAMEYLEGLTLAELVEHYGPVPPARAIYILAQVAHALAAAHARGIIHRDVKPANIVLCDRDGAADLVKVVDFGLAKYVDGGASKSLVDTITGTPLYMAPEQITAPESIDARADIYALGAVGYYLLTGTDVFTANSVVEICAHHLHTEPDDPSQRLGERLPADLVAVVLECLAKDPADRFDDALVLREALLACQAAADWSLSAAVTWWERSGASIEARQKLRAGRMEPGEETMAVARTLPGDRSAA